MCMSSFAERTEDTPSAGESDGTLGVIGYWNTRAAWHGPVMSLSKGVR